MAISNPRLDLTVSLEIVSIAIHVYLIVLDPIIILFMSLDFCEQFLGHKHKIPEA